MDHASQMAAARELRASFSGQPSTGSRRPVGRSGGRNFQYDSSTAPHYPQPALGRHATFQPPLGRRATFQPRSATGTGVSASVGAPGSSSEKVPPHLRPAVSRNTKQVIGVVQFPDNKGSVAADPPRTTPPHLRGPVGHPPEQLAGSPQNTPPHLRTPAGSSTEQPAGTGGSGDGQNPGTKFQTGNSQALGTSQAFGNGLGGLQNSRFAHDTQPTQSTPLTQTATLKDTRTTKQAVSVDSNDNSPVVGHSTGRHIRSSAQDALPPHLRQFARGPAQQSGGADTVGGAQGGSADFNFHAGDTQTNDVFNFHHGNSKTAAGRPQVLQNSQFAKGAQPPTSSALEATNTTASRAKSAANADNHAPVNHLPETTSSQTSRGHGGLKNSRFASNAQLGTTRLTTPDTATSSHDNNYEGMASGATPHDGQQRHISKYTTLPAVAKEAPAFVPTATKSVMAPSTAQPGLMTPEPDNKRDDMSTDVEMMDAGRDPAIGNATKITYGGVLQSRWAPRSAPDTKALPADVLGYRVSLSNATLNSAENNNFQAS